MIREALHSLLAEIDAHCAAYGVSLSAFGRAAVNDSAVLHDIKRGARSPSVKTMEKLQAHLRAERERLEKETTQGDGAAA